MAKTFCIVKKDADKLKQAFKTGKISIENLYSLGSSKKRIELLSKYVGDGAKPLNASLEKAYISPNQKMAFKNWVYKNIAGSKPLYNTISISDAKKLSALDVKELKQMTSEQRIKEISKYVDGNKANKLNDRFEVLQKSGNLKMWEEKAMGTSELRKSDKIKGELAKIEALDDIGILNPKETRDFMESFVESKLGVSVSVEEGTQISKLVKEQSAAFDKLNASGDWTFKNKDTMMEFFNAKKGLDDYIASLGEDSVIETVSDLARANILASPRILRNSLLYQALPATERAITKRLITGNFSDGVLKSNIIEKLQAKLSGIIPTKKMASFIKEQTAMALEIYHKTGYDISRMETLDGGKKIFGEKFGSMKGKSFKESKGFFGKTKAGIRTVASKMNLAPKWLAGGTDTLFANIGRADTSTMLSKEIAKFEKIKGILPKGMTEIERADQLLKESYSFTTKDAKAIEIRRTAILDAHKMNGTQIIEISKSLNKFRDNLNLGKFKLGKLIMPFVKIPATIAAEGVRVASGAGIVRSIKKLHMASKKVGVERIAMMQEGTDDLIRYLGFTGAAVFVASMLDTNDYKGAYESMTYKSYKLLKAENAGTDMIRIGGKWVPLRFLPIINIPIAAIMQARKVKEGGGSAVAGFMAGIFGQITSMPGVKETRNIVGKKFTAIIKSKDKKDTLKTVGLNDKFLDSDIFNWAKVRVAPSIISYDLYNAIKKKENKYDFLGRKVEGKSGILELRRNTSNDLTKEVNRLDNKGEAPTISDPNVDSEKISKRIEKIGVDEYIIKLNELKVKLAEKNMSLIKTSRYKKATDEEKKKMINANRKKYLTDRLK